MSTVPSARNLVKHQLCAIWHDLTFFCFGLFYLPLFFFLISDGRKTMSVGTLHSLQWPWSLFPPTWVTLQTKGWKILPSAAREDLRSGHPPPTLGIDRKRVLGQVHDGAFCLGHPKSHLAEDKIGGRALETLQVWSCLLLTGTDLIREWVLPILNSHFFHLQMPLFELKLKLWVLSERYSLLNHQGSFEVRLRTLKKIFTLVYWYQ